jgi:hypothetical protein
MDGIAWVYISEDPGLGACSIAIERWGVARGRGISTVAVVGKQRVRDIHDCLLFYTKSERYCWNTVFTPYDERYKARFKNVDPDGRRWYDDNLSAPGIRHGFSGMEWRGHNPTRDGNHWKMNNEAVTELVGEQHTKKLNTIEKLDLLDSHGLLYWPGGDGYPRFKRVLGLGLTPQDIISDIPPLNSQAQERWGCFRGAPSPAARVRIRSL